MSGSSAIGSIDPRATFPMSVDEGGTARARRSGGGDPDRTPPANTAVTATQLARARKEYEASQRRSSLLGPRMSAEPAWNILLDLFISGAANRTLSVSAVCIGARSPAATALRYLSLLQEAGLVERSQDTSDGRRSHVRLTTKGWSKMLALLR